MFEAARPKGESAEFCEHGVNRGGAPVFDFFDYFLFKQKKVIGMGEKKQITRQIIHGRAAPLVTIIKIDMIFFLFSSR